jgi:hypothetical protein
VLAERLLHNIWILEVIRYKDPKNIAAESFRAYLENNKLPQFTYPEPRAEDSISICFVLKEQRMFSSCFLSSKLTLVGKDETWKR